MEKSLTEQPKIEPALKPDNIKKPELLKGRHFDYTLVFGQGPVQERDRMPRSGREGLNVYSRMISLAAARMLKEGITDKVILSGGATGARTGTPDAKTEADLMADVIRRNLTTLSKDGMSYIANGKEIPIRDAQDNPRPRGVIDAEIADAFADRILIENEAQDTLQNFAFILNKYVDKSGQEAASMALLGISFHAKDTYSGAGIGRLEVLADIFGINGTVYASEDVVRELLVDQSGHSPREKLRAIVDATEHHEVSKLKSLQEKLLVEGLNTGEWTRILGAISSQDRAKDMILRSAYVKETLMSQLGISENEIVSMDFSDLLDSMQTLKVQGTPSEYREVKEAVFDALSKMTDEKGTDYLARYGKGTILKPENQA